MSSDIDVDGSFFTFPDGWRVAKVDEWSEQTKLTRKPYFAKGCDVVAVQEGTAWLIEAKDYTYPGAKVPSNLHEEVGKKVWDTLALLHAVARWGHGERQDFSRRALDSETLRVCLAMEVPDRGRKERGVATPLAHQRERLQTVTRLMGLAHPTVSNSFLAADVPWTVRRDPTRRRRHLDR